MPSRSRYFPPCRKPRWMPRTWPPCWKCRRTRNWATMPSPASKLSKALRKSPVMIADQLGRRHPGGLSRPRGVRARLPQFLHRPRHLRRARAHRRRGAGRPVRRGQQRRGQVRGAGLQFHQYRQALPHRPSLHHDDRQRPLQTLQVLRLEGRGRQPSGRLGHAVWQDDRRLQKVGRPRDGGARRPWTKWSSSTCASTRRRKNDPALEDEGRAWFKKIEDGDEEALSIFNWFKEVTLKDAQKTYELLGVTFDSYAGESFYNDKMGPIVEELKEKGLLKEDKGGDDRRSRALRHAPGAHPPLRRARRCI